MKGLKFMSPFALYFKRSRPTLLRFKSFLEYNLLWRDISHNGGKLQKTRILIRQNFGMEKNLIALNMYLNELGVPPVIDTIDDRKRVQKAVYLGQAAGINLNYEFSWYLHGPYSNELTRDYYKLAGALLAEEDPLNKDAHNEGDLKLKDSVREKLKTLEPITKKPEGFPLEQVD